MAEYIPGQMAASVEEEAQESVGAFLTPDTNNNESVADAMRKLRSDLEDVSVDFADAIWNYANGNMAPGELQSVYLEAVEVFGYYSDDPNPPKHPAQSARDFLVALNVPVPAFLRPQE